MLHVFSPKYDRVKQAANTLGREMDPCNDERKGNKSRLKDRGIIKGGIYYSSPPPLPIFLFFFFFFIKQTKKSFSFASLRLNFLCKTVHFHVVKRFDSSRSMKLKVSFNQGCNGIKKMCRWD